MTFVWIAIGIAIGGAIGFGVLVYALQGTRMK